MAPKLEVDGSELGGNGGAVRGRRRETAEILCGAHTSCRGGKAFQKTPGGGSSPIVFLGLTDSTQLDGLGSAPQGVAHPINWENRGR